MSRGILSKSKSLVGNLLLQWVSEQELVEQNVTHRSTTFMVLLRSLRVQGHRSGPGRGLGVSVLSLGDDPKT